MKRSPLSILLQRGSNLKRKSDGTVLNEISPKSIQLLYTLFLIAVLALVSQSALNFFKLGTRYSAQQFFPKQHQLLKNDERIRTTFGLSQTTPLYFVIDLKKGKTWMNRSRIERLKDLTFSLKKIDGVQTTLALPLVQGALSQGSDLFIGNLFEQGSPKKWAQQIRQNPLLYPLLITPDLKSTLVIVDLIKGSKFSVHEIKKEIGDQIAAAFPDATVHSSGVPLIQSEISKLLLPEVVRNLILVIFVFCALLYFLFNHWSAIVLTFTVITISNLVVLASLAALHIPINAVLVTLPIIVSTALMSIIIHTLHLWALRPHDENETLEARFERAFEILKELLLPNILGAATTALGFVALGSSPILIIREYGWVVSFGVIGACALSMPLLLFGLPLVKPVLRQWFRQPARWVLLPCKYPKSTLLTLTAIGLCGLALFPRLNFSARLFDDLPVGNSVRSDTFWMDTHFNGTISYQLMLVGKKGHWANTLPLQQLDRALAEVRAVPGIKSAISVSDFFWPKLPRTNADLAERQFLFSMAERNPLPKFMNSDGSSVLIEMQMQDEESSQIEKLRHTTQKILSKYFPQLEQVEAGRATISHQINQEASHDLVLGFWKALLLIGLMVAFIFRSLRWALVACLPNLLAPAVMVGLMAFSQTPIKPAIALAFSIALGFAFNNTIYLLSRYQKMARRFQDPNLILKRTLNHEGYPCLFESLVMAGGFSIFLISSFPMTQFFGVLMLISIVAGFAGDLWLMPALLRWRPNILPQLASQAAAQGSFNLGRSPRIAPSLLLLFFIIIASALVAQAETAPEVLRKTRKLLDARDDSAQIEMKIIETDGSSKERTIDLKTRRQGGLSVMARILEPADVKGMGFLGVLKGGRQSQWVYLPSNGQVRRVVASKSASGLLGSELSSDDLNPDIFRSPNVKIVGEDEQSWTIELIPRKNQSVYSKIQTKILKSNHLPEQTEYFKGSKKVKRVDFKNYRQLGKIWRARNVEITNLENGRSTLLNLTAMKVNSGLSARNFSQSALKDF